MKYELNLYEDNILNTIVYQPFIEMAKSIDEDGNIILIDGKFKKILSPKQYEQEKRTRNGVIIGTKTNGGDITDGIVIKSIHEHAHDQMIIRGYSGSAIVHVLKNGVESSDPNRPWSIRYQIDFLRVAIKKDIGEITTVVRRNKRMKTLNYNLQENVNMEFIDLEIDLFDKGKEFLKENFNISDVNNLSDDDYMKLYDELCDIEEDEVIKAINESTEENQKSISGYGNMVASIVTYMGNQFIEGGRRFEEEDILNTVIDLT